MGWFIPYERWTLRSPLSPDKVMARLDELVAPPPFFWMRQRRDCRFWGRLEGQRFRFSPSIRGQNVFLPVMIGEVYEDSTGSRLEICFRVNGLVVLLLLAFTVGLAAGLFGGQPGYVPIICLGVYVFVFNAIGFVPAKEKAKKLLAKALHAGKMEQPGQKNPR